MKLSFFNIHFFETLQHMRFFYGFRLLVPFLYALLFYRFDSGVSYSNFQWIFLAGILHGLVYPSSHLFNAFYDKDRGPIGGIERPPQVQPHYLILSHILDLISLSAGLWIDIRVSVGLFVYIFFSRAYSGFKWRLKSKPIIGSLVVAICQGPLIFYMTGVALNPNQSIGVFGTVPYVLLLMASGLFILAGYPLTQIYQHDEDEARGDLTLSRLLGYNGTIQFSSIVGFLHAMTVLLFSMRYLGIWQIALIGFGLFCSSALAIFWVQNGQFGYTQTHRMLGQNALVYQLLVIVALFF